MRGTQFIVHVQIISLHSFKPAESHNCCRHSPTIAGANSSKGHEITKTLIQYNMCDAGWGL